MDRPHVQHCVGLHEGLARLRQLLRRHPEPSVGIRHLGPGEGSPKAEPFVLVSAAKVEQGYRQGRPAVSRVLLVDVRRVRGPSDSNYPNVWLGVSVEAVKYEWRLEELVRLPAAVRFLSYEPALESIYQVSLEDIDWVIAGGESGPGFRPADPDWFREMRDRCHVYGMPFFFKQSGGLRPGTGEELDGEVIHEFPNPRYRLLQRQHIKEGA